MAAKETIGDGGGREYANSQFSDQNRQDAISRVSAVQQWGKQPYYRPAKGYIINSLIY